MIQLIIYGIVIAALVGGAFAIKGNIEEIGEKRILDKWGALITKCEASKRGAADCAAEWTSALAANLSLQADVARIDQERQQCSAGVEELGRLEQQARADKAKAIAANASKITDLETDVAAMKAFISRPKKPGATCDETVATIDTTLRDLAARRMLGFAPAADSERGKDAPPGDGSGSDTLRLTP